MGNISLNIGTVREIEGTNSVDGYDGLRVRAELMQDKPDGDYSKIPWAFPILPKTLQVIPKKGEAVFVIVDDEGDKSTSQRYFIGPIISQPQYNTKSEKENSTTLLQTHDRNPIGKISNYDATRGAFPKSEDVAVVGRGQEDIILRYGTSSSEGDSNKGNVSEIDLRTGIRGEPTNSDNPDLVGNVIFNDIDPAYIQLKYKQGLITGESTKANSVINMVADRINIMSNRDNNVSDSLHDKNTLVKETDINETMEKLHQVPKGDELVKLLKIMKGCILHHVHPWAGMEQCGDWAGFIQELNSYTIEDILSEYVRIS